MLPLERFLPLSKQQDLATHRDKRQGVRTPYIEGVTTHGKQLRPGHLAILYLCAPQAIAPFSRVDFLRERDTALLSFNDDATQPNKYDGNGVQPARRQHD